MVYRTLIFLFSISLHALPIKVPTDRYSHFPNANLLSTFYPFISCFTFRSICDKIIDNQTEWFDPEEVKLGDTIYLNLWYLDWFAKEVHPKIPHPYILVSGDVGAWFPHPSLKNFVQDPKLAAWFCRNMIFSYHPKFVQIPMGQDFALFHPENGGVVPTLLQIINDPILERKHFLYMNHYPRPHGDRDKIVRLFENESYCFTRNKDNQHEFLDLWDYWKELKQSRFVLSPLGLETDCVRTWEAIVLGSIPIVEHTFLDPSYDKLPVILVHNWEEVNPLFLETKYEEVKNRGKEEAYFDYWDRLIKQIQTRVRNQDLNFTELEATQFSHEEISDFTAILKEQHLEDRPIIYKGLLTSARPLQIGNALQTTLFLQDYYCNRLYEELSHYLSSYFEKTVSLLNGDQEFLNRVHYAHDTPIFLDLTYYRTSLFTNFSTSIIREGNFRHSLLKDLTLLYHLLPPTAFLFGNMRSDTYVKEVLEKFAKTAGACIETKGSFWFITK